MKSYKYSRGDEIIVINNKKHPLIPMSAVLTITYVGATTCKATDGTTIYTLSFNEIKPK